ncbi:MAG: mannose-1-phosphate guanylyltransferase [Bacteroidetes bacterium]|nr:MAG: mannose-1-phosphate guanylyltransferase [Bacteroidota bacterium]
MDSNMYAVIMAGGVGSRFWPVSTRNHPKQFIDILGTGKSLIRQTYERFLKLVPAENIYVVTNKDYFDLVKKHIPELADAQILGEPSAKNTAPCVAYATHRIVKENSNANIIVAPSDHLILDEQEFLRIVKEGLDYTAQNDSLLCIGIKPHRPDTGYGYIQFKEEEAAPSIHPVKTFTEKPDLALAQTFLDSGDFLWNAGIFIWNAQSIISAFQKLLPEMDVLFADLEPMMGTDKEAEALVNAYQLCTNISIDYGILEKAENVTVYPGDFGWSDLGTWASLYDVYPKDAENNAVNGKRVQLYDSNSNMVCVPDDKLVVLNGIQDLIVVDSAKALLISRKDREQDVKQIVTDTKLKYGEKYS